MVLHGDIMIDGRQVGAWKATRAGRVGGTDDDPTYEYNVKADADGVEPVRTTLRHSESHGPVLLAVSALITLLGDGEDLT